MSGEVTDWRDGLGKRMRPDGTFVWVARWNDRNGQKRTETFPPGTSWKDAKAARLERVRQSQIGIHQGSETWSMFVEETFWPLKEGHLRAGTLDQYRRAWVLHLEPFFGKMRLRDLRTSHVQQWVIQSSLHPATLRRVLTTMSAITKAASVLDLASPIDYPALTLPKTQPYEPRFLTMEQVHELSRMVGDYYEPDIIFLATTGLRWGEFAALNMEDIDLEKRRVWVSKSWDRKQLGPTKNGKSRLVDLFDPAVEAIRQKKELRLAYGNAASPVMFPARMGGRLHVSHFRSDWWQPAVEALGWPRTRIHDLRHTNASLLVGMGASPHYVSKHLGHATVSFTMDMYAHQFEEQRESQTMMINEAFREASDG